MGETINQMKNQLNEFWQGLDKNKKIKLGVSALLIILAVSAIVYFTTRTDYQVLYSNLSSRDAGEVTKKLDETGVKWKLSSDGNTILVPSNLKNKIKIDLATQGLPKDGYSFLDAFNETSWTMTDFDKKQRIKYALQSELASTISEIEGIDSATVYVDIPERSGFVLNDERSSTASVFLKLSNNYQIAPDKVIAIKNLVASSSGMTPENVSVIDDAGRLLGSENHNGGFNLTDQLNVQQNLQIRLNESLMRFLSNLFGYGNVDVRSNIKINYDSEIINIVEFSPPIEGSEEGLIRSMEKIRETMVNGADGGVTGTEPNTEDDYGTVDNNTSRFDKSSEVINYELNEINKQIKRAPGEVESVTVAILINEAAVPGGQLTEEMKKDISDLIYAATGLDTKQVKVSAARFNNNLQQDDFMLGDDRSNNPLIWALLVALFVFAGTTGVLLVKSRKKEDNYNINDLLEQKTSEMVNIEEIDFEGEKSQAKAQINNFLEKKPDAVAQLLRSWLNEE